MLRVRALCTVSLLISLAASCRSDGAGSDPEMASGATLYAQCNVRYEKDRFQTTNYLRGVLLPINSEVTVHSKRRREITVVVKQTGRRLAIRNNARHTGLDLDAAFARVFAPEPVDVSGFSEAEQRAIEAASVEQGMSRAAVIAAIGHPPASLTPSLEGNEWVYQKMRFADRYVVRFGQDGRVTEIVD